MCRDFPRRDHGRSQCTAMAPSDSITLRTYARRWLAAPLDVLGAETAENYARSFRLHLTALLDLPLVDLRRQIIRHALRSMLSAGKSRSTVKNALTALSS